MALKLGEAETKLRAFTQHKVDTRLSQAEAWEYLNDGYRWARQQLQLIAPSLYLSTSSEITFDDVDPGDSENEIVLSDNDVNFDHISHVERKAPNGVRFYGIERTNPLSPTQVVHGQVSFTLEHKCLRLHHHAGLTGGTYRVRHWVVPAKLTDINAYFQLPSSLELAMIYNAAGLVALQDRDGVAAKAKWDDEAKKELDRAAPALSKQYGIHEDQGGVRRVMGR